MSETGRWSWGFGKDCQAWGAGNPGVGEAGPATYTEWSQM